MSQQPTQAELVDEPARPRQARSIGSPSRSSMRWTAKRPLDVLRPCLDVDRWLAEVADGRPYGSLSDLETAAREAADPLTAEEVEGALAHHPRIGERAAGSSAEATLSRSEQAGLQTSDDVLARLEAGNRAYEERFGRVFLIRAAGRSSEEILAALETRLG